jgi:protein TonB
MIIRYLSALAASTLVTLAILFAMQGLIDLQPGAESSHRAGIPTILTRTRIKPPPPPEPPEVIDKDKLTEVITPPTGRPGDESGTGFGIPVFSGNPAPVPTHRPDLSQPDGPLICVVRVQPTYPPIATERGLEGWVDVRFDVMTNGLTANIEILRSSNRIFEKSGFASKPRW